ncbi:MAG: hypothetical protein FRX49_03174 [Trebouxia sp. A1-2]|nr:MAG: hypothetical protein FRX49_03174 [Trebouxia sp. A1-2]
MSAEIRQHTHECRNSLQYLKNNVEIRREDQSRNLPLATSDIAASKHRRRYEASKACRSQA